MYGTILLVDDDPVMLKLIPRMLNEVAPEYELLSIDNSIAALALIAQHPIALIITDQHMPDMDGIALTIAIKAAAPQCPVILITGSSTPESEQQAAAAGADCFMPKPFGIDQLASAVQVALGTNGSSVAQAEASRSSGSGAC